MAARGLLSELPAITAVSVLGLGLLTLGLGYPWFWVVFVVGFAAAVPLSAIVSEALLAAPAAPADETPSPDRSEREALAALRERYARGEIDEATFERRVDRLLATETVEEARAWVRERDPGGREERTPADVETERS